MDDEQVSTRLRACCQRPRPWLIDGPIVTVGRGTSLFQLQNTSLQHFAFEEKLHAARPRRPSWTGGDSIKAVVAKTVANLDACARGLPPADVFDRDLEY